MIRYSKKKANGFVWTLDQKLGRGGFTVHHLYFEEDRQHFVATIIRPRRLPDGTKVQYILRRRNKSDAYYGELNKAKRVAENWALLNLRKLGYKVVRK